jgi:hypothetical protein
MQGNSDIKTLHSYKNYDNYCLIGYIAQEHSYTAIQNRIPDDSNLHIHRCENLESHKNYDVYFFFIQKVQYMPDYGNINKDY